MGYNSFQVQTEIYFRFAFEAINACYYVIKYSYIEPNQSDKLVFQYQTEIHFRFVFYFDPFVFLNQIVLFLYLLDESAKKYKNKIVSMYRVKIHIHIEVG